jgi:YVTN family beta-propeller protein
MHERSRIGVGIVALALVASCGSRALDTDGGSLGGSPGAGGRGTGLGGLGGSPTGGQSGSLGSGGVSGQGGTIGIAGIGGAAGGAGTGGRGGGGGLVGGRGGAGGAGGISGRGGAGGTAGTGGTGGRGATGGTGGIGGIGGRGGSGATGGISGAGGRGGTGATAGAGGIGGRGGFGGEPGRGGQGGTSGSGGIAGSGGVAGSGGSGGIGGTGGTVCLTCRSALLPIAARDVVYNAARNHIYASVAGDAEAYPNTIVVVDPSTSSVVSTIPIGSNPRTLALSDDGSTLWVGIDGAHAMRKVTMNSTPPVVGPLIRLTSANPTRYFDANSIAVLPGAPLSVAVAYSTAPYQYSNEVRVFDDGVPRPVAVSGTFTASFLTPGPPGLLFGHMASPGYLFVFDVSPMGVTQTVHNSVFRDLPSSIVYSAGRVYSGSGDVIDVTNPTAPTWVGGFGRVGVVAMRDAQSVLMLTTGQNTFPFMLRADVRVFSTSTFGQLDAVQLRDSLAPIWNTVYRRLVHAGGDAVAFLRSDDPGYTGVSRLAVVHDPVFGTPVGGAGGAGGAGGTGGVGGTGGTGGAPNPCPGCTFTTAQAYGHHFAHDPGRNLIYLSAGVEAPLHPSTIVTVDATTAAVTSFVPVGNDPWPLALSDDGSALWVGLAGERRVRRMTPGPTPVPGPAYALPTLLTTGDPAVPASIVVLPGTPSSIAVTGYGARYGGQGVFILDDGQLRANYIQPPEIPSSFLVNGPPGYLLSIGAGDNLIVYRLGTVGATLESYAGLVSSYQSGLVYSAGVAYASNGEVIDLTNPDRPLPLGRFGFAGCALAVRSATRVLMLCPNPAGFAPILRVLDSSNFVPVGAVTLPDSPYGQAWADFAYIGGDAVALLGHGLPLQIMRAPIIGTPP